MGNTGMCAGLKTKKIAGEALMSMMKEFREFAMRGNVVDLAVGVVIGGAFGKIVSSVVADVIMPPLGLLMGGVNFTGLKLVLKEAAGDKIPAVQFVVDPGEAALIVRAVGLAELLVLRNDDACGEGVRVAPEHAGGRTDLEFDAARQHVDACSLERVAAEHGRGGVETFEVAADGDSFGQEASVIELKRRQLAKRVARKMLGLLQFAGHDADFNSRQLDTLLGQENADAAGVRRRHRRVEEFHAGVPS